MSRTPLLGAIAVVLKDGHVLLARRERGGAMLWGYPGGHVEWGETALAAAERELAEETGVTARALGYLTNVDVLMAAPDGAVGVHYLLAAVLCSYVDGTPEAAEEIAEARWVPFADVEAGRLTLHDQVAEVLALARVALAGDVPAGTGG